MALRDLEKNLYEKEEPKREIKNPAPDASNLKKEPLTEEGWSWPKDESENDIYNEEKISSFVSRFGKYGSKIFWSLIIVTILIIGLGIFYVFEYQKGQQISLDVTAPQKVMVGVPFEIKVNFGNESSNPLKGAQLSLSLPEGAFLTNENNKRVFTADLGDVNSNQNVTTDIPVVLYGQPNSIEKFPVVISYYPSSLGSTARFEKEDDVDVAVGDPAIKIDLSAPQKVLSGENFDVKVQYQNVSDFKFSGLQIQLSLPPSFTAKKSTPSTPTANTWVIGDLDKGGGGTIDVEGSILAAEQSFFNINAAAKLGVNIVSGKSTSVSIAQSPLSLSITTANNQTDYVTHTNDSLQYVLSYRNNSDVGLNDIVITAKLTGDMFDFSRLVSNGFYNSQNNTVTWNAASVPELRLIQPGASGNVQLIIATKTAYPIRRLADKNFVLKVDGQISSPTVPYYVSADKTISIAHFETKVAGAVAIQSKLYYRDPTSSIKNSGPIPPKVNTPTTFTAHWLITNWANDLKNISVKATLPSGVRIVAGNITSNTGSVPIYDDRNSEITWNIDGIIANKGVLSNPAEAVFQIEATPNSNQVGQPMPVLNQTQLIAADSFASSTVSATADSLTTQLSDDKTITFDQTKVVP